MRKVTTLVLIVEESRALLGMKKRGFGVGKWNGFGGKVEPNETVNDAAIREIQEEAGITPLDMKQIGLMAFDFPDLSCVPLLVHVFKAKTYKGTITESEEMCPKWFDTNAIPFNDMWQDDILWFPHMFEDRPFVATFTFQELHTMIDSDVKDLSNEKFEGKSFEELARTI